ncbi:hypothetical protein MASR2M78_35980 [Treponema sp.]
MEQCADLFIDWGGHDFAAGFSMKKEHWDAFIERLKIASASIELGNESDEETIVIDAELPPSYLNPDILGIVDRFEPFGEENEQLVFMTKKLKISELSFMGKGEVRHVKLLLDAGKHSWPAIYWQAADKVKKDFDLGDTVDIVYRFKRNYFNGNEIPQLIVADLKRS